MAISKNTQEPVSGLMLDNGTTRRQLLIRSGAFAALLALPGGIVSACGSSESEALDLTHLRWGIPPAVENLSPNVFSASGVNLAALGLEAPLVVDTHGKVRPWLAEKWTNKENKEFVLTIRDGVKWSDGTPMTTEDILSQYEFNLSEEAQPLYGYYPQFGIIKIEQTGPREITVHAEKPNPRIPSVVLASQASWMVQPAFLKKTGYEQMGSPGALPIGTGPYVFDSFVPESSVTLRRNKHYWNKDLTLIPETISVEVIGEGSTRILAARSHEIYGSNMIEPFELPQWENIEGFSTYSVPAISTWFFFLNNVSPPFDDVHVRRAMAYALDRKGIVQACWAGNAEPAKTLVPPECWHDFLSKQEVDQLYGSIPNYEFDLATAEGELKKSKYPEGFAVSIQVSEAIPQQAKICQIYARSLQKLGINLQLKPVSENVYFDRLFKNDPNDTSNLIKINSTPAESLDPIPHLDDFLASRNAKEGLNNFAHFINPEVDRLLEQQASITEPRQRGKYIAQIVRIATEEVPYVPITWPQIGASTGPGIDYVNFNPFIFLGGEPWPAGLRKG